MQFGNGNRLPLTEEEEATVNTLLEEHGQASLCRRDPGETGPVLVQFEDKTFEVDEVGEWSEV